MRSSCYSKVSRLRFYKLGIDGTVEEIKSMGIENESLDVEHLEEIERQRARNDEYDRKQNSKEKHRGKLRLQGKATIAVER